MNQIPAISVFVLMFFVCMQVHGQPPAFDAATASATMAKHLNDAQMSVQAALAQVAATPEAHAGDWSAIEPKLDEAAKSQGLNGAWFFMRPDGSYFQLGKGLTTLNVSDRPYFAPLFAGTTVSGYPLYSRTTGKKSAFFAAPVIHDGKVTGAIAASIFLDDWYMSINAAFPMPENFTWYVVNWKGETILDRDPEFIFINAMEKGSPSLQQGLKQMAGKESGKFNYEIGGVSRFAVFNSLPGIDWRLVVARMDASGAPTALDQKMKLRLQKIKKELQVNLNSMDSRISAAIAPLQRTITSAGDVRPVLQRVVTENQLAIDAALVDTNDILVVIEPPEYRSSEGSSIASSRRTEMIRTKNGPLLTDAFVAVEGMTAVSLSYPLYTSSGDLFGTVSVMVNPALMFAKVVGRQLGGDHEIWAMQKDGTIIYDANEEEIGRVLFTDPMYANFHNLLTLGRTIASEPAGQGNYLFTSGTSGEDAVKVAEWDTVSLHGTEWRIVLIRKPYIN